MLKDAVAYCAVNNSQNNQNQGDMLCQTDIDDRRHNPEANPEADQGQARESWLWNHAEELIPIRPAQGINHEW